MKKSAPPLNQENDITLEFPVPPDSVPQRPPIDPQAMLQRIAENMAQRKKRPGEDARRAAEKIPVEFVL